MATMKYRVNRRAALGLIGGSTASLLIPVPGARVSAQTLDKVSYQTNWRAQTEHGGFYLAAANGIYKRYGIEVGRFSFYINMLILGGSMGIVGMEKMLYGFVSSYVSGQSIDSVLSSFDKRRLVLIMTKETKPVVKYISDELRRGSTLLYGEGGFSGESRPTIMCLLTPRQTMVLKRYLAKNHPKSFMVVSEASEVMGKGFKHWKNI